MEILLFTALIVLNGVFTMSEITLITARRAHLADDGVAAAAAAMKLHDEPTRFLSTVQVGITSIGILNGIVGEAALAKILARPVDGARHSDAQAPTRAERNTPVWARFF